MYLDVSLTPSLRLPETLLLLLLLHLLLLFYQPPTAGYRVAVRQCQHAGILRSDPGVYSGSVRAENTHTRERASLLGVTSPFHFFSGFKCAYRTALHLLRAGSFSSSRPRLRSFLPAVWCQRQSEASGLEDLNSSSGAAGGDAAA